MNYILRSIYSDDDAAMMAWLGFSASSPGAVRAVIDKAKEKGEGLTLLVNSPGGSAISGVEIRNILADSGIEVTAVVQSMAASAASYAVLSAGKVLMAPGSQMMLHRPLCRTEGNVDTHKQSEQMLDAMYDSMLNLYCRRCGEKATREELDTICRAETWLTADRCVELGLADGLYEAAADPNTMVAAMGEPVNMEKLRAIYMDAVAGVMPGQKPGTADHDAWKLRAKIEIEKQKYKI